MPVPETKTRTVTDEFYESDKATIKVTSTASIDPPSSHIDKSNANV